MGRTRLLRMPVSAGVLFAAVFALFGLAVLTSTAHAQIRINEILPNPVGNDVGTERIEIYNAGATPIDVTGWAIDDAATIDEVAVRCRMPEDFDATCSTNPIIQPGEFRVIKGTSTAAFLNQGGDDVYLISDRTLTPTVVHLVTYPSASAVEGQVWAALPNGSSTFAFRTPSMCGSNGATGDIVPPGAIANLAAVPGAFPGEIRLTWTAPGDDGATGTASAYTMKVSSVPITAGTFTASADLDRWINEPLPSAGGVAETLFVFGFDPDSTWYFAIETADEVPNLSTVSNSPGTAPLAGALLDPDLGYSVYFGNLHSHTGYSDGVQTPPDAYTFARFTAPTPLDFLAVTDHNHVSAGMQLSNYALGMSAAAAANEDGAFVAIYGQEWGLATNGHINIFEAPVLFGWDPGQYDVLTPEGDYPTLYSAVLANPPASYPPVALWCHPAVSDFGNMVVTPASQSVVHLMCLVNGPSTSSSTTESDIGNTGFDDEFKIALRKGHRVSPTGDQDNHNATWGAATESRTAVLASALTKSNILNALAVSRNYATQDHNVRVDFSANGHAMGEAFTAASGVRVAVGVSDPDIGEGASKIELFRGITGSSDAVLVAYSTGSATLQWRELTTFANGTEAHYYVRVTMLDNQNVWTGPVYVTYDASVPVAVGDGPVLDGRIALSAMPNPTHGDMTAEFTLPAADARVSLAIYDVTGRRVRALLDMPMGAGAHRITWDGRSQDGRPQNGLFFLRLSTTRGTVSKKVMVLR